MRMFRIHTAVLALVVLSAGWAHAADVLLPGHKLLLSDQPGHQRVTFAAKSPLIVAPTAHSSDDPTAVGGTLRIVVADSGESATFDLPASNWATNGRATLYKFKNAAAPAAPSEVKIALLKNGTVKIDARAAGITLNEPSQSAIGIVLTTGTVRYCALFGGAIRRNAPGTFSAKNAPAPTECPGGSATPRPGVSTDVILSSNVDGAAIAITVHEPTEFFAGRKYPLILEGHGYGGSRVKAANRPATGDPGVVGRLLDAGYGIISIDQRGHGDSGGKIRVLDPDFEGKDLIQIIDWAEATLPWLAYRDDNLLLGATGASYGGGFQHTIYAHDPQHRLDAIAPEITWHDLRYSLFSGTVFKSFWATVLSAVGNTTPGGQDQEVNDGLVNGLATNSLTQQQQDLLKKVSLVSACEAGTLPKIDALYWQSASDTLFNMNDAAHNFECVSALGGDVRMLTKNSGHDALFPGLGGAVGEQCGDLQKAQAIVDWYDEKLKGMAGKASYIPKHCFHMDGTTNDAVVTDTLPIGGQTFQVPVTLVVAQDDSPQVASVLLTTIGPGGAVLAGIPTIQLNVSDPTGLELGDPILFLGLAKRAAGGATDTLLQANQVRPFRGYGSFDDELIGQTARLAAGDEVRLLIYASYAMRYQGSGSDTAAPVDVDATVGLPLLPANLPAPPAN